MRSLNTLLKNGQISTELLKIIECGRPMVRTERVREYFKERPKEKKEYERQYNALLKKLKTAGKVTACIPEGSTLAKVNLVYKAGCGAANQPMMTLTRQLQEMNGEAIKKVLPLTGRVGSVNKGYRRGRTIGDGHQY